MTEVKNSKALSDAIKHTTQAFDLSGPSDEKTFLRLTESEYADVERSWERLTKSERADFLATVGKNVAVADLVLYYFSRGKSYADYASSYDNYKKQAESGDVAKGVESGKSLLANVRILLKDSEKSADPAQKIKLRAAAQVLLNNARKEIFSLLPNDIAIGHPAAVALDGEIAEEKKKLQDLDEVKSLRTYRLFHTFGALDDKKMPSTAANVLPKTLGTHEFALGAAKISLLTPGQFGALPVSSKVNRPRPPLSVDLLSVPPYFDAYKKIDRGESIKQIIDYIEHPPTDRRTHSVLRGLVNVLRLPFRLVVALIDLIRRLFGAQVDIKLLLEGANPVPSKEELRHLQPKQALWLAQRIVVDAMTYDFTAIVKNNAGDRAGRAIRKSEQLDAVSIHEFLQGRPGKEKLAVCRHYAQAVQLVFECIKALQDPANNQLRNCYMRTVASDTHIWNALFMVQNDGSVAATQIDATKFDQFPSSFLQPNFGAEDYLCFGAVSPLAPHGERQFWLENMLTLAAAPVEQWVGSLLKDTLGEKSVDAAILRLAELSDADIKRLSEACENLPSGSRNALIDLFLFLPEPSLKKWRSYREQNNLPLERETPAGPS